MYKHSECIRNTYGAHVMCARLSYSCYIISNENVCLYAIEWNFIKISIPFDYFTPIIVSLAIFLLFLHRLSYLIFMFYPTFSLSELQNHFICIPYLPIILCLFCFTQSLSLYACESLVHAPILCCVYATFIPCTSFQSTTFCMLNWPIF